MKKPPQNPAQENERRQITSLVPRGSRSKPQTTRTPNQMWERVIRGNPKDQYLIKENKSIPVGKHVSHQFGLTVLDLFQNNKAGGGGAEGCWGGEKGLVDMDSVAIAGQEGGIGD